MEYVGELESKSFPGFYYVPGFDQVLVNVEGRVIDLRRKCCPLPRLDSSGYHVVNCDRGTFHIHRLIALTFIDVPEDVKTKAIVNHIDGIKLNNHPSNIEWVDYSGNIEHAYRTGLRKDNRPVLVKDIRTNEITRYYGVTELARKMNVSPATIVLYLKDYNRGKLSWNFYVLIYEGDQWPVVDEELIGKHRNGTAKDVVVDDASNNIRYIFDSLGEACRQLGLNYNAIAMHIYRHGEKPRNGLSFRYIDDPVLYAEVMA